MKEVNEKVTWQDQKKKKDGDDDGWLTILPDNFIDSFLWDLTEL